MKKTTIRLEPYEVRAKFIKDEFIIEIDGCRGNNWESRYTIILCGWSTFGHYIVQVCYEAVKERVKQVLDWKEDFKEKVKDES